MDSELLEKEYNELLFGLDMETGHIKWAVDTEMPIISQNKFYIENIFKNTGKVE